MDEESFAISVEGISKLFGRKEVLRGVSFSVKKGNIHDLLGHNGAGKTTLFRIILCLLNPNKGNVRIFGKDVKEESTVKSKIGYVSEYPAFYSSITVKENLVRFGNLKGVEDCNRVVEELISRFELSEYAILTVVMVTIVDSAHLPYILILRGLASSLLLALPLGYVTLLNSMLMPSKYSSLLFMFLLLMAFFPMQGVFSMFSTSLGLFETITFSIIIAPIILIVISMAETIILKDKIVELTMINQ